MQHALGRLDDAVASFGKALALAPEATQARCARATVLAALGRHEAAEDDLRLALEAAPDDSHARHNLGVLLAERGQAAAALCEYDRVLGVDPRHAGARANRAALRLARGDAEGALEDYGTLCTDARPAADSRRGLVRALLLLHRDAEALDQAQRLVEQHPEDPLATDLKAIALASLGRLAEAQRCFGGADGRAKARSAFIDRALERQKVCDWSDRSRLVEAIREALADPQPGELASEAVLFHAHALPLRAAELKAISARVAQAIRSSAENLGLGPYIAGPAGGRLRVGFLSSGVRNHPEARLLRRVMSERDRDRFEYFLYALNADDGSVFRAAVVESADHFVEASSWATDRIVRTIREDRLDLLVDLSGNLVGARPEVLAARVAPLQADYIGPPCTLGPGLLDYRLSDAAATPAGHQADWHEKLVLLPVPHWTYDVDQAVGDPATRQAHGLPDEGFVYCAFHQAFKISPEVFSAWMRLLSRIPDSVLWLIDGGGTMRANLTLQARAAGVDPARLVFARPVDSLEGHLARQRHADLFLDTLHYGAQTTAADALRVGLPVLTCRGQTMASRLCASLVQGAGIPELIVASLDEYEQKALELGSTPSLLHGLRAKLAGARGAAPFFAPTERVRALERAFAAMIERQRAGLPPETLCLD